MGITGNDFAKEEANVLLMDEELGKVISIMALARGNFANISKFISHTISYSLVTGFLHIFGTLAIGKALFVPI